jgi:hypothetical protein
LPSFELTGPERVYSTRDVNGTPLGTVQPGDIRMFDDAPDSWWVPVIPPGTGEAASEAAPADAPDPGPAPEPEPAASPVPAPPAVVPQAGSAFAVTTDQQ